MDRYIAEVTNKYGDPESLAERELTIDGAVLQKLPIGTKLYAQLEKAPEPVAWARRHPDGSVTNEYLSEQAIDGSRKKSGAWLPLYTSPPEVAELQKQLDHAEMAATQEAKYADELRKQVQALQADNERLNIGNKNLFDENVALITEAGRLLEFEVIWGNDDESRAKLHASLLKHGYSKANALHLAGCTDYDSIKAENERFRCPPDVATVAIELEIDNQLTASAMDPNRMFRQDGWAVHAAFIEALDKEKL